MWHSRVEVFRTEVLRGLADRGLRGVRLVIADDHTGQRAAARRVLNITHRRCRIHRMRTALVHAPVKQRGAVAAMLKTIFARESKAEAVANCLVLAPLGLGHVCSGAVQWWWQHPDEVVCYAAPLSLERGLPNLGNGQAVTPPYGSRYLQLRDANGGWLAGPSDIVTLADGVLRHGRIVSPDLAAETWPPPSTVAEADKAFGTRAETALDPVEPTVPVDKAGDADLHGRFRTERDGIVQRVGVGIGLMQVARLHRL